ncbi:PAS domain S-box protein [Sulfurimonas marina]|uniref:PAS domain S-box protein n=1 Tax=Sulfurimonas marina TaxID=2590551 RepID=A0A7M3V9D3_9BACT|nr:PAS domain S-box protein [Sulfurimonas marina]QOP40366.1 PAS domain S-box protein [Sulfurimonas marina]
MRVLNHLYQDKLSLRSFIENEHILNNDSVLIQVFSSNATDEEFFRVRRELKEFLPQCAIVGSSTAGIVENGKIVDDVISISFSIFENSTVKTKSSSHLTAEKLLEVVSEELITPKTKLLIFFANTFTLDSEMFLKFVTQEYPSLIIAGGNGADDFKFEGARLFSDTCEYCDAAFAAIDSDVLEVQTASLLNWQSIGKEFTVTKVENTRLYEIDNKPILEVYEHYFGKEVVEHILKLGTKFPLICNKNGIDVARAPISVHKDGSLTLAGRLKEGMKVKFGFANVHDIEDYNNHELLEKYPYKMEAVYIYSCSARRSMLNGYLNNEISAIEKIAPSSGFITYGEFFHDIESKSNFLLNITTTFVMLSEKKPNELIVQESTSSVKDEQEITLKALTTFISKTSNELDENLFYLEQFKEAVDEVSIFSVTNKQGIIQDVNKNFETISGYKREELIGKPHNIVRHPDMPHEAFEDMWKTIQSGKIWKGMVKNRRKDGRPYYVLTEISPIYHKDGSFKEYIGVRNDITELEEYKEILKTELSTTKKSLDDQVYYIKQYEEAVNSTISILKTDANNKITYANHTFCRFMKCNLSELLGRDCSEIRHKRHLEEQLCAKIKQRLENKEVLKETLTNIAKDGTEFTVETTMYPILDAKGNVVEHLQVMHDITEIIKLNEEITNTQKEVVMTMGAIGETRSKETGLHVKRVAEYSYLLAKLAGLDEDEAMLLKQASPMHDIGKVGIPDSILNKPGRFTEEEFEVMKTHTSLGYEMLKHSNKRILNTSSIVAYTHHEKYDGTGYPNALKGEDIHIYGRITAVADVFDALGHDRVYKKAWELERILELFKNERGKHFDPKLVDLFFEHLEQFLEIRKQYESEF